MTTRLVSVAGARLRVSVETGQGSSPLLLCSGLGASFELWEPLRRALRGIPTIAFDAPGVGGSDTPRCPPTIRDLAATVDCLLAELGIDAADVLGVSWGGALAQELTRRHPQRVRHLVLAATTPGIIAVPGDPRALAILATPLRYWSRSYFERVAPALYGGEILDDPALLHRQGWLRFNHQVGMRAYVWQLLAARRWTSLPWLHRLAHPTLVLAGDSDPIIPIVNARILAARIPNATLHVVPGGGHLFLLTRADEVASTIREFLSTATTVAPPAPPIPTTKGTSHGEPRRTTTALRHRAQ
jgi:poly(3-hydroxyoctanoate) depolymerase